MSSEKKFNLEFAVTSKGDFFDVEDGFAFPSG